MAKPKKKPAVKGKAASKTKKTAAIKKAAPKVAKKRKPKSKPKSLAYKVVRSGKYLSNKQKENWNSKSPAEQAEYLEQYPDSKYKKLGVKKDEGGSSKVQDNENEQNVSNTTTNDAVSDGNDSKTGEEKGGEKKPSLSERIKTGLSSIFKVNPKDIKSDTNQEFVDSVRDTINDPQNQADAIKQALADYEKNKPTAPKSRIDYAGLAIGAAAILAVGALGVAAPGLAIVIGLQMMEKTPEILEQWNARSQRLSEEREKNAEKEGEYQKHDAESLQQALSDMMPTYLEEHPETAEEVRKAAENTDETASEKSAEESTDGKPPEQTAENTETGTPTTEEKPTTEPTPTPETTVSEPGLGDPRPVGESTDQQLEDVAKTVDTVETPEVVEEDEEEETPPPKKKRKKRVQAELLTLVESSFENLENFDTPYSTAIDGALDYLKKREEIKAAEETKGSGTYAALKLHPSSARLLSDWAKAQGIKNAFPPGELHITICYSKKPIDYKPLSFIHGGRKVEPKDLGLLGRDEKKSLVLHLNDGGFPHRRFRYAQSIGATHDFPEYLPHITLAPPGHGIEDVGEFNFDGLNFPLIVDYEYSDALQVNASDVPNEGYIVNKPNPVKAETLSSDGSLTTKDGATQNYKKGDMRLSDKGGNVWTVKPAIFKEKYVKQDDGTWDKKKMNLAYRIHTGDEPITIKTLEGPVEANKGDVIITGTSGEEWPIPITRFHELYSVIIDDQVEAFLKLSQ